MGNNISLCKNYYGTKDLRLSYLGKSILAVITNEPFSHLWYLYMILGLYIIQPVLFQFIRSSSQKMFCY